MAQLSISDIRRELLRTAGDYDASGSRSSAPAGTLFHEVLAGLMGPNGWQAALEPGELADSDRLAKYAYDNLLGPRLTEMQASLRESGAEAMFLWEAVRATCDWLSSLLTAAEQHGIIRYNHQKRTWFGAEHLCQPELELEWEVKEPHWTAPVRVFGVADALWKNPESGHWCVLEYKLGRPRPEADLAQACLYHCALASRGMTNGDGALAVITFGPELKERFYRSAELSECQAALRALIGRMANVLPQASPKPAPAVNESHQALGKQLVRVLQQYGVPVEWKGEVTAGPSFLRYFVLPGRQTRLRQVKDKAEDLGMQLHLKNEPMIHNSDGRLVIDIARPDPQVVTFSSILDQLPKPDERGCSQAPLGVDLNGRLQFVDLASSNNPHLLVAGTSGSGKTAWLTCALAGLMFSNTPETLRLVLIDPKRTAFAELKGSPYLHGSNGLVYPQEHSVIEVLDSLIEEMERRYQLFEQNLVIDLPEYQAKTGKVLPRIVCVCDEYADLLIDRAATKNVAAAIGRLGAKARAAGIHLIIATQYPDRKTVEGALKMNLGGRVCLRVSNHHQSNMIINQSGAERLLGNGDLFFLSIGDPVRLQAPFLPAEERARFY
ncbi:MAG TPA: DNA translocase FtsK [Bryobacteraceae bacterium]|nr:DNA translocase FtsK [Bryobacteraceae bacterium]